MAIRDGLAWIVRWAGHLIGEIEFNRIRLDATRGCRRVLKRRRGYAPFLVLAGNLYIRLCRRPIRILPNRAWLRRERRLYRRLYGEVATVQPGGWLDMPWLGRSLSSYLTCPHTAPADALRALACAARALHRLHAMHVVDNGVWRRFSHGDAGVRNATCDPVQGSAHWFDFEIVHGRDVSDVWRHADDLRAFLFSALGCLPEAAGDEAVRVVREAYPDAAVHRCLRQRISRGELDFDTYHLAQTQMGGAAHRRAASRILRLLDEGKGTVPP